MSVESPKVPSSVTSAGTVPLADRREISGAWISST
jgi:hypothetical protein